VWCTQKAMGMLFDCTSDNISVHLQNIYDTDELKKEATTEKISVVRREGNRDVNRTLQFYNLDAIISVGYRVNSIRATQFRQWADMGQLVNGVLELAERIAKRHIPMTMEDWAKQIDTILAAGGNEVLQTAGSVSAEEAKEHAETEFEKYRIVQDRLFQSDFDKYLGELPFDGEK